MAPAQRLWFLACLLAFPYGTLAQQQAALAYTPSVSTCPKSVELVRHAGTTDIQILSSDEEAYINARESKVLPQAWATYLKNVQSNAKASRTVIPSYVNDILGSHDPALFPRLAVTASGGGYRAAIFSAGVLNAIDGRNVSSVESGLGGLLQSATYIGGLSGGSWLISSLIQANFPMLPELIFGPGTLSQNASSGANVFGGWLALYDLLEPSADPEVDEEFVELLLEEVAGKALAGFPITVTDLWGRSVARHFTNGTTLANFFNPNLTHGAGITLSGLVNLPTFEQHTIPFPYLVMDSVSKFENQNPALLVGGESVPLTNPVYEISPFEFGSYDPMLGAFTPTQFLGSREGKCTTGFDQVAYIAGASSNLWNAFNTSAAALAESSIGPVIAAINETFPQQGIELDAAAVPNPFVGLSPKTYIDSNQTLLALVDGGDDGEVSPLQPMLVKARAVDVMFVMDAPADTVDDFTNGSSLISTSRRVALFPQAYSFPHVPKSPNTFVSEGLVKRPTFFGCDTELDAPMLIYIANGGAPLGQAPLTNTPTMQSTYNNTQLQAMLNQINDIATQGIPSHDQKDPEWPVCLACGVVDRARRRLGIARTGVCAQCLERYCWDD